MLYLHYKVRQIIFKFQTNQKHQTLHYISNAKRKKSRYHCPQKKKKKRDLLTLHLQGAEIGPPRGWNLQKSNERDELTYERHL